MIPGPVAMAFQTASGEAWIGGSAWFGEPVVRISVCSWMTTEADVTRAVAAMAEASC